MRCLRHLKHLWKRSFRMTCLEAQSKLIAYIDHKLEKDQKIEFLKHIQSCEDCKEELNIYYTMIEGMRQLDNNATLSENFTEELNLRMEHEMKVNRNKKGFFRSSVAIVLICLLSFGIVTYVNFLNLLHEEEQAKLKEAQGDYYYMQTFGDILFEPEEQQLILNVDNEEPEMTFYERVRYYNVVNE